MTHQQTSQAMNRETRTQWDARVGFHWLAIVLGCLAMPVVAQNQRPQIRHYTWDTMGRNEGGMEIRAYPHGRFQVKFEFNDRGRGPKLDERWQLDEHGALTSFEVKGHGYMGGPVEETFTVDQGKATWKSLGEAGSAESKAGAFYLPRDNAFFLFEVLAKALSKSETGQLSVLPSGTVSLAELGKLTLKKDGKKIPVRLVNFVGMSTSPTYIWLTEDHEFFAMVGGGWARLIRKGWESSLEEMKQFQEQADDRLLRSLAKRLTVSAERGPLVLKDVRLLDVDAGRLESVSAVFIFDGQIAAIYREAVAIPEQATVIEGQGRVLIPGLFDMHDHAGGWRNLLHIAGGVTTARDLANHHEAFTHLRRGVREGSLIGPRLWGAGFIDKKSPYSAPAGRLAETLEEAVEIAHWYARHGYRHIKIYSSMEPEWVAPLANEIHGLGMRLSGHIPSFMTTERAVLDGFDEIQHINFVFLNFLAGSKDDTRTPLRFSLVGEKAASLDLESKEVVSFIELLARKQVVVDPTVTIFETMFLDRQGSPPPGMKPVFEHLPVSMQRAYLGQTMAIAPEHEQAYRDAVPALLSMIGKLHRAGVRLVAGTDDIPGFTLHRELELYEQAGIPRAAVLRLATLGAAEILGLDQQFGSIEPGKVADLILLDGNPLEHMSQIRKVALVIQNGKLFKPADIYREIGIKPFSPPPRIILADTK